MDNSSDYNKAKVAADERARLRRNQRNSRARKQEYVQDLERRWSECVRLGVQASIEIQREARRIQEENEVLRSFLHEVGISDEAIRHRLELARILRDPPACDAQNNASAAPSFTASTATTPASSGFSANRPLAVDQSTTWSRPTIPVAHLSQNVPQGPPVTNVTGPVNQLPGSFVPEAPPPDGTQSWDLYSWVNDLSSIKDAYSINAQSNFGQNDPLSHHNTFHFDFTEPDIATGAQLNQFHGTEIEGVPWSVSGSQSESNGNAPLQNLAIERLPTAVDGWYPPDWTT